MKTYFWDFFGPHAENSARHFLKHLDEFLLEHGCGECTTQMTSLAEQHHAVQCEAPNDKQALIERALRPRRSVP